MNFHIITLFPESFDSYLGESILSRAIKNKKIGVKFYNPRDFVRPTKSQNKNPKPYLRVDDKPYAGGPGMVMQALPVIKAIEKAITHPQSLSYNKRGESDKKPLIVWLTPSGKQFDNEVAEKISKKHSDMVVICGRYEGIDERVVKVIKNFKGVKIEKISVGPFVLTGGELPAMIVLDTVARRVPGVLGNFDSLEESRISSSEVYTRPEILEYKGKKYRVPKVLLSGNHKKIEEWKQKK